MKQFVIQTLTLTICVFGIMYAEETDLHRVLKYATSVGEANKQATALLCNQIQTITQLSMQDIRKLAQDSLDLFRANIQGGGAFGDVVAAAQRKASGQANQSPHAEELQAFLNAQDDDGMTALHLAARLGLNGVVHLLLTFNADCCLNNKEGDTPLHNAIEHCPSFVDETNQQEIDLMRQFVETTALLAQHGQKHTDTTFLQIPGHQGNTALHLLMAHPTLGPLLLGDYVANDSLNIDFQRKNDKGLTIIDIFEQESARLETVFGERACIRIGGNAALGFALGAAIGEQQRRQRNNFVDAGIDADSEVVFDVDRGFTAATND